jgi:serpin B
MRSLWLPALMVVVVGCQDAERQRVEAVRKNLDQIEKAIQRHNERQAKSASNDNKPTHVIVTDTAYYKVGPQQAQPPDGTLRGGTKVTIVEEVGSYVRVRSVDGVVAYVAADALKQIGGQTNSDLSALVNGNNQFAFDLYGRLRAEPGNLFFSPSSISTALAMTYGGARAETATQMADVLHFDLAQDRLDTAFAALLDRLGVTKQGIEVRIANRLWGQAGYRFLPTYLQLAKEHYGAELGQVDFAQQTEAVRQEINAWVEEQTNDKIKDLIPAGVLNQLTRLVLTNAIYFKGDWAARFDKQATEELPFHLSADEKVDVPMMFQNGEFKYGAVDDVQILELPYIGSGFSMFVMLPKDVAGLAPVEEKLTPDNLGKWLSAPRKQKVDVYLPKFTMTSQFSLNGVLQAMGMTAAFDSDTADFSGMTGKKGLYLTAVIHKAFVDVNEEGTEAAAATGVVVGVKSIQVTPAFRADHPFVFLIRDNQTESILFMGRLADPAASSE